MTAPTSNTVRPLKADPKLPAAAVQIAGVQKVFDTNRGRHEALTSIDLEINDGEFLTILGPSGCGKTTLLRILAGFEHPTRGDVLLDGKQITTMPPNKRPMAMVFQSYALFPHLTVFENIAYGLKIAKTPRAEITERVEVVLLIMDLVGLGDRRPTQLSGGQQQRVALARSVVVRPRVLLFDEPLSNLDARLRDQMRSELRRIQRQLGVTSVYVTHDQSEAMAMSDRIVVMSDGRIEQVGSPDEIYRRPTSLFVADFIGKANVLPVKVISSGTTRLSLELFGQEITVDDPGSSENGVTLVLRPEDVNIATLASPNDHQTVSDGSTIDVAGWLRGAEYLGAETNLTIELLDGTLLKATQHHTATSGPGDLPSEGSGVVATILVDALRAVVTVS